MAELAAQRVDAAARRAALTATQKALEEQIAGITERRSSIEQRMYAATSSSGRDLQAMNDEVRHLTERRAELEELELVAMLDQDPVDGELAVLRERRAPDRGTGRGAPGPGGKRRGSRSMPRLPPPSGARAAEAALLPPALADRYETLRSRLVGSRRRAWWATAATDATSSCPPSRSRGSAPCPPGEMADLRAVRADPRSRLNRVPRPC